MKQGIRVALAALWIGAGACIAGGQTIYVDVANNTGIENGSQASPYNTIQEGVNAAAVSGVVQVAAGTYTERVNITNRNSLTVQGAAGALLNNGTDYKFVVDNSRDVTIRGFIIHSGVNGLKVQYSTNVVIDGNTVRGMYTAGAYGLNAQFSKLTVMNNTFTNMSVDYGYPAGYFWSCTLDYVNNKVIDCQGNSTIGGLQVVNNDGTNYKVSIRDNFFKNVKAGWKGALDLYCMGLLEVKGNVFNECGPFYRTDGVGYSYDCGGMVDVYLFSGATNNFVNNVFRNPAYHYYGPFKGVHIRSGSSTVGALVFRNNIFQDVSGYTNYTPTGEYAIWNQSTMTPTVDYNDAHNMAYSGVTAGTGSLAADPLFVSPTNDNFHLLAGSPAINAGNPAAQYNDTDGSRNDMGAYGGPAGNTLGGGGGGGSTNTAPVANGQSVTTAEDTSKAITLTATDAETNALTYAIVAGPAHGSLSGTAPSVTYNPAANYFGSDSFTFRASDGSLTSNVATVSITVTAVNDAPVAFDQGVTTTQGVAKAITLAASDIDSGSLTYSIAVNPANGTLSGTPPNVTYTPAAGFNGSDSFRFRAYDGALFSNTGTVSVTVVPLISGTVYVNASNNSGVENGSAANPFNTIQEGVNAAVSGAVIQVAAGIYPETVTIFGRGFLTLRGAGVASSVTNAAEKIKIINSDGITVDGFDLNGGGRAGVYISLSTNVLVKNTTIENIHRDPFGGGGDSGGGFESYTSSVTVVSNVIRNITYVSDRQRGGGQRGGAGFFNGCSLDFSGNQVTNCYAWAQAGGVWVQNPTTNQPVRITRNLFDLTTADSSGAIDASGYFSQLAIENNVITKSGATCGNTNGSLGAIRVEVWNTNDPVSVVNNVVADPPNSGCVVGGTRVGLYLVNPGNIYIANNILVSSVTAYGIRARLSPNPGVVVEYNDTYGTSYLNVSGGTGALSANPLFVSGSDFHLQSGSLCVNAGNPAAAYNDANGTRNDMGRYGGPNGY